MRIPIQTMATRRGGSPQPIGRYGRDADHAPVPQEVGPEDGHGHRDTSRKPALRKTFAQNAGYTAVECLETLLGVNTSNLLLRPQGGGVFFVILGES